MSVRVGRLAKHMTFVALESAPSNATRIPSIVILGADALLAALPATPVQLAHACALAGYQSVIPVSWGDELIAAASLRALRQHGHLPAIQCSCPHVAHRLLAVGTDLRPFLVSLVAPPVVLARYLRAVHTRGKLRITYVGRCPGAADESIDARLTPDELLAMFSDRHIVLDEQPEVFDSVIPPDRRRYRSQPGGLPTPEMLWASAENGGVSRTLVELYGELPMELAQQLLAGKPTLVDVAPALGCVCSGAIPSVDPADARARVAALEPPRATRPVVDEDLNIEADLALPASVRSAIDAVSQPATADMPVYSNTAAVPEESPRTMRQDHVSHQPPTTAVPDSGGAPPLGHGRRNSPARGVTRHASGTLPAARDADGRQLPRTYVARRRSPARRAASSTSAPTVPDESGTERADLTPPNGSPGVATREPPPLADHAADEASAIAPAGGVIAAVDIQAAQSAMPVAESHAPGADRPADSTRFAERAVNLPVTPRSDSPPRHDVAPVTPERPVMQLLTLGLLIAMVVLVSAAVGVLVGRWMTQR